MRRKRQRLLGEIHLGAQQSTDSSWPRGFLQEHAGLSTCSHRLFQGLWAHPPEAGRAPGTSRASLGSPVRRGGSGAFYEPCRPLSRKASALLQTSSDAHIYLKKKRKGRKAILFHCQTVHFKYPFYYSICIVILIIDLVGSSNEAGEYKVSNKVNCCL